MRGMFYTFIYVILAAGLCSAPVMAEEAPASAAMAGQKETAIAELLKENALLKEKLRIFENSPAISGDALALKNYQRLREIAADVKTQRQTMTDFAGFVTWMTANLSGYAKYIEAGSMAAGVARFLPIPYAGQASLLSKFASQGVLSLNAASVAITRYLATAQQFVTRAEALDPGKPAEVSELVRFTDGPFLKDMDDVQLKLKTTSDISASTLSFLETLSSYLESTDEYWKKTKSFLAGKETDRKEKGFLSESIRNLRNRAGNFNAKLRLFDETARKDGPLIKSVAAYDDLVRELGIRVAAARK